MAYQVMDKIIAILNPKRWKKEDEYLDNILAEYKSKKGSYDEFRIAAHKTIKALLEESGYKFQILSRTKSEVSLAEKLVRKKERGVFYHSIEEVEDVVGIRVIFYTERDKEGFIERLEREIDGFMRIEEKEQRSGYRATHVIMSFGPKRLNLSEYKHFKGLKSEVQLTSILHHAWAEIEHDLIYKDVSDLKNKDPEKFELLKHKMGELLDKYIIPSQKYVIVAPHP